MPSRNEIINVIGSEHLIANIENDEFSYQKAFDNTSVPFAKIKIQGSGRSYHKNVDMRFADDSRKFVILVETKQNFDKSFEDAKSQLNAYMQYEKLLTGYDMIGILANTADSRIRVWKEYVSDANLLSSETVLKSFDEYYDLLKPKHKNNREEVMKNTYNLNELLHEYGITEKLRGQFVGTCLLAIKNDLVYKNLNTRQISAGIKSVLEKLLDHDLNKAGKLSILGQKVIDSQDVRSLTDRQFEIVLDFIKERIFPFINDKSTLGQDLLNLFFTTFNKYVGKSDKNQAFTPDHIVEFMCKAIGINKNSRVLDPCCGSGSFLVRALTDELDDCDTEEERTAVKKNHIYGIEYEETAYGLSTTNMLIHGDGNSNIVNDSCFNRYQWIKDAQIDRVLMNPPYNAQKKHCKEEYVKTWGSTQKEDPSKGFHFVYEIAEQMKSGKLAVLLPMQCAIGTSSEIRKYKELMLQRHHLDAVFSLPDDIFHPGANSCACCMIFDIGIKHEKAPVKETFFGYFKDDGFQKRKNLGRVEIRDGIFKNEIEPKWLSLYRGRNTLDGISVVRAVNYQDEWLAEAYIKTDYSLLNEDDFQNSLNNYLSFLIKTGDIYES